MVFGIDDLLIGGLMSGIGGGLLGAAADVHNQSVTNKMNVDEAQKNRDFQERMSNTSYQRSMEDMQKAGLNPMLAYMKGGASTPSGAQANVQSTKIQDTLARLGSNAMEARKIQKELDATDSQVSLNKAAEAAKLAETKLTESNARIAQKNESILDAKMPAIKKQAEYDNKAAGYDAIMKRIREGTGLINDAKSILSPPIPLRIPEAKTHNRSPRYKSARQEHLEMLELRELEKAGEKGIDVP